ncbi:PAS domain-containing sensor histidine kinase [Pseudodesulfovibrio sp.]|uniref:PAS domain-containing protein n=1 Tax=Pseudodesulfovibrio sp. TaxID=2035812 RepID=UPI002602D9C2|nr:PAS domain-containing sensor histidine kinase [Pseudodesulfovibrio sp.]MDD3311533.1 PAS domain-containing sensor histidine kinase [Pseudodesulfovibrio sp.]
MYFIGITSTLLQFAAGVLALRLIADTGRNRAWLLLSAGIFAMAFRRLHSVVTLYRSGDSAPLGYELLGLAISALIFAGVYNIGPLLRQMRQSAEKLARSEERYRTVALFTHNWEYWMKPDGRYEYVSPACEGITGYPPEAFMADPRLFRTLVHPEDREAVLNRFSSLESLQKPMQFDCRIQDAQGRTRWIAFNSVPVRGEGGVNLGVRASVREIGRRKALEQDLTHSRALCRGLVENSRCLVLRLNDEGAVAFANRYATDHLGADGNDVVGRSLDAIFESQGGGETAKAAIEAFLRGGTRLELEMELRGRDGVPVWIEWTGSSIRDDHGAVTEYVCLGLDVTRRKALDGRGEDMARIVGQDMRPLLKGIIGVPRRLREADNLTPDQKELLETVEDAGDVMLDVIGRPLTLYRLETGTCELRRQEFDLLALLRSLARRLPPGGGEPGGVRVTQAGSPPDETAEVRIRADRTLVYILFCNLLRNALDAYGGRPVTMDVTANGEACVSIRNAGVVPAAIRDTFFGKHVTMNKREGTGLGAYSARLIARRHGGDVTMHSAEGQGTVVTVTLPRKA